ncbi:hypothetical protein FACS1894187_03260 [Synergistales bacterium]|nr:hypothetical protein FACS1894187_03260 [Synergistales bacterium]
MDISFDFQEKVLKTERNTEIIEVVLLDHDPKGGYSRWVGVAATSIFQNTKNRVNINILCDSTLTDDNRSRFIRTAEHFGQSVSFVNASEQFLRISAALNKTLLHQSIGSIYRLLIPDLLNIPKVIYMDSDIVVNLDIAELWNIPIENHSLAAVKSSLYTYPNTIRVKIIEWVLRCTSEDSFNSGVMLMNLSRIKQEYHDLVLEIPRFFKRYSCLYLDAALEDMFLNYYFSRDAISLDERFNRWMPDSTIDNSILHYIADKPWYNPQCSLRNALFWEIYASSEWGDIPVDEPIAQPTRGIYINWQNLKLALPHLPVRYRVKHVALYILHILRYIPPLLKEVCSRVVERFMSWLHVKSL